MKRIGASVALLTVGATLTGAQGAGPGARVAGQPSVKVIDPRLESSNAILGEKDLFLIVSEIRQGSADLNGDGDVEDDVLHHVSLPDGTVTNLGLDAYHPREGKLPGRRLVFTVRESKQEVDLNGDGDALDQVVFSYDPATSMLANSGLAVRFGGSGSVSGGGGSVSIFDGLAFFSASEPGQRADLNGDGDSSDYVLHVWEEGTSPRRLGLDNGGYELPVSDDSIHFYLSVKEPAGTDLNGDGDSVDRVLHVFDRSSGVVTNLGLVAAELRLSGDGVAFLVPELQQGLDLNGDGDEWDHVFHVHAPDLGTVDLGVAAGSFCVSPYGPCSNYLLFLGEWIVMNVGEPEQGGTDLDGDGDTDDVVLFAHRRGTSVSTNLGISHNLLTAASREYVVHEELEGPIGGDLNGDGDTADDVLFLRRYDEPAPVNTGLVRAGMEDFQDLALDHDWLGVLVSESNQGGADLNGDADAQDSVLHLVHGRTGERRNLGLAAGASTRFSGGKPRFAVSESDQGGADLNADGDALDQICFYYDATWDFLVDTRAEGIPLFENGRFTVLRVTETGGDLNGDGDTLDVLIRVLVTGQRYR